MMKSLLIVFLLLPAGLFATHNRFTGRVTDAVTGEFVVGASVFIPELKIGTTTDESGAFKFKDLGGERYELMVSFLGFASQKVVIQAGLPVEISLIPVALNLGEVVVNNPKDMAKTMSVVSKIDLQLRPVKSSQDILRMVPGLFTAQHAGGGKAEQIYLRGFDIDHGTDIRIAVDGMPVNMVSHAHGQGYADLHFLIPETVQKVDFDKGPYYPGQGDFATAGYVDFSTRNALERSTVKVEAGKFDTYRAVGLVDLSGKNKSNQSAYFASELLFTNGPFENKQYFNRINLMGKYHALIGDDRVLTASVSTFTSKWDASGQIPDRAVRQGRISRFGAVENTEGGATSRTNANIKLAKMFDNGDILKNQFFYTRNEFRLFSNFTFFLNDPVNGDEIRQSEKRDLFGYNLSCDFNRNLGETSLQTTLGLNVRYDQTHGTELAHTRKRNTFLRYAALGDIDQLNAALYADTRWTLSQHLSVQAGLRFDQFSFGYVNQLDTFYRHQVATANVLGPKLNIFYNFNRTFQLYAKSGVGFHSNDARVVVPRSGAQVLPRAFGLDLGAFIKPFPRLLLQVAAWGLDLEQEFVYVGDEAVIEPSGKTRRYGLDFSARYQLTDWLFADTDLNVTVPRSREDPEGENYIPLAPTFSSIGGLTTKFQQGLNASLRYRAVGDRPANEVNSVTALGYVVLDGGLTFTRKKYELGLSFENLLNVDWNEAQFDTESRLFNEVAPVSELHYTPGTPFFVKAVVSFHF